GGATQDRDAAAPVGAHDHARVGHVVPVDRGPGPRHVRGARDADAGFVWRGGFRLYEMRTACTPLSTPPGRLAPHGGGHAVAGALGAPARRLDDLVDAF